MKSKRIINRRIVFNVPPINFHYFAVLVALRCIMNVIIVNKGIIMKKILYFSVCILFLFFSLYLFAYKKEISFTINSSEIILKIPPAPSKIGRASCRESV